TVGNPCGIIGGMTWKKTNDTTWKFFATSNTGTGTTYFWNWGDGTTSTGKDATHVYKKSGTYEVCLKIYDTKKKCFVYICRKIVITLPAAKKCTWANLPLKIGYTNDCNKYTFEMANFADSCIKYQLSVYNIKTGAITALTPGRLGTYTFGDTGKFAIIGKYSNVCTGCDTQTYTTFTVTCKPATTAKCNWAAAGATLSYSNKTACNTYFFEGKNMNLNGGNCIKYTIVVGNSGASTTYKARTATHTFTTNGTYNVCIKYYDSCKACDTLICTSVKVDCCNAKASIEPSKIAMSIATNAKRVEENNASRALSTSRKPCHQRVENPTGGHAIDLAELNDNTKMSASGKYTTPSTVYVTSRNARRPRGESCIRGS
ncbi:MAG: PKD domain-containing protein, partial [Actinobacteria bacterium]|nr:PKD domain-containing protein [Actinomycetota bacterium]